MLHIKERYANSSNRSKEAIWNIVLSFVAKGVSVACSLLIVPLTINYVNPTRYGIWLTLSSIIAWVYLFYFGMGHGFRNKFAEAKAKEDHELVKQYVSTAYFSISIIVLCLLLFVYVVNQFINWTAILNVDSGYYGELKSVFAIVSNFFCINLIANLLTTMLTADQKPGYAAMLNAVGQVISLLVIFLLTQTSEGSLYNLALYYSGVPTIVLIACSFYAFRFTRFKAYQPHYKFVKFQLVNSITNIGFQFFIINISLIFVFQLMNLVITRELGPEAVTEYNIAYKYFNVLTILIMIVVTPFWSGFTDAYNKADYQWMKNSVKKLEQIWTLSAFGAVVMILIANLFYKIWIGHDVVVQMSTTLSLAIYVSLYNIGQIYMYLINGIGTIKIQLIIYLSFALLAWPLMVLSCRWFGLPGIVIVPSIVVILQAVFGKIQIYKIIEGHATGLWGK